MVFVRSALTWHHFYALTLVRLVADFLDFCIGPLELVVKNKKEEKNDVGMNVHMLSSVCRARQLKKKSSYYSKAGIIAFSSSPNSI